MPAKAAGSLAKPARLLTRGGVGGRQANRRAPQLTASCARLVYVSSTGAQPPASERQELWLPAAQPASPRAEPSVSCPAEGMSAFAYTGPQPLQTAATMPWMLFRPYTPPARIVLDAVLTRQTILTRPPIICRRYSRNSSHPSWRLVTKDIPVTIVGQFLCWRSGYDLSLATARITAPNKPATTIIPITSWCIGSARRPYRFVRP